MYFEDFLFCSCVHLFGPQSVALRTAAPTTAVVVAPQLHLKLVSGSVVNCIVFLSRHTSSQLRDGVTELQDRDKLFLSRAFEMGLYFKKVPLSV